MRRVLLGVLLAAAVLTPATAKTQPPAPSAFGHLEEILRVSTAPAYRRPGSPGMAKTASYAAKTLREAGYTVVRQDTEASIFAVDYAEDHGPLLELVEDGRRFKAEAVFKARSTGAEGITCTVKAIDEVHSGDCGFVPFAIASPEWKKSAVGEVTGQVGAGLDQVSPEFKKLAMGQLTGKAAAAFDQIKAAGGVGAVVQGDVDRDAVVALQMAKGIPAVVAVAEEAEVKDKRVRLRAMGGNQATPIKNVIGVRRPPVGSTDYVMLLAHADGWFQAAADNGAGVAAVLRAAELLAQQSPKVGVVAALVDGEEVGYHGSRALSQTLLGPGLDLGDGGAPLRMSDLHTVVNIDASTARAAEIQDPVHELAGTDAPVFSWRTMVFSEHATLPGLFLGTFAEHGVLGLPVPSQAAVAAFGGWRSDAGFFHDAGVPVAWPAVGYPEYHTDVDTEAVIDVADLENVAKAAATLVGRLAGVPRTPILQ